MLALGVEKLVQCAHEVTVIGVNRSAEAENYVSDYSRYRGTAIADRENLNS